IIIRRTLIAMNGKWQIRLLLAAFVALNLIAPAFGQQSSGSIRGSITDVHGAPIPDARVWVTSSSSGQTLTLNSSRDGSFEVANLPGGVFTVAVEAAGYNRSTRKITVRNGKAAELKQALDQAGPGSEAPEDVTSLKNRIDGLEAQNRELADQNRAIMQALAELKARIDIPGEVAHASLTKPSTAAGDANLVPSAAAAGRVDGAATTTSRPAAQGVSGGAKAESQSSGSGGAGKAQSSSRWSEAISEGNQFKLHGALRLDMLIDSQRPNNAQSPLFIPSPDPLAGGKP